MTLDLKYYKETLHFSINFYSLFLIATFIPDLFYVDNSLIKNFFWGLKILLACWVIYRRAFEHTSLRSEEVLFFILAFVYIANLYIDIYLDPLYFITTADGNLDFAGFCLGILIAYSFRYDPAFHSSKSFFFFWITLTAGLVLAYFFAIENLSIDANNVRYDANSTINTILYGQAGCALALVSVFGMVDKKNKVLKVLFLLTFFFGLVSIAKAGSRSPVVVLFVIGVFYFLARLGAVKGLIYFGLIITLLLLNLENIAALLESMGSSLGTRIVNILVEGDTSGREILYNETIDLIKESPLVGVYYVIPSGMGFKSYPHNFFLEVLLATGLLGAIPFIILVCKSLIKSFNLLKDKHESSWMVIIYLQIIVYGMFSTSLYSSQDFWTMLFFIVSLKYVAVKGPTPLVKHNLRSIERSLVLNKKSYAKY
ncbi:O-antigen ligase family protein [Pontibacter ruber]|uniref:O-antigen ligase family protein n=1 Tax=Pontibacter ruber TaxID=1343895 RepID=A0ABW5CUW4_9BACT|nr:O-antigen ligase family protein [Pontibacter ruber]